MRKKFLARYGARTYAGAAIAKRRWLLWQEYRREALAGLRDFWRSRVDVVIVDQMEHP